MIATTKEIRERPDVTLKCFRGAVNPRTQEEFDVLMQVYEFVGWRWSGSWDKPTANKEYWEKHREETCVDTGIDWEYKEWREFGYGEISLYENNGITPLLPNEFYKLNKIDSEQRRRIGVYLRSLEKAA
jgi:hypothetical protein|tara:strand:- start:439 stop:825 length:387 start_codon:yes stop_codon:yes gene_type:complete